MQLISCCTLSCAPSSPSSGTPSRSTAVDHRLAAALLERVHRRLLHLTHHAPLHTTMRIESSRAHRSTNTVDDRRQIRKTIGDISSGLGLPGGIIASANSAAGSRAAGVCALATTVPLGGGERWTISNERSRAKSRLPIPAAAAEDDDNSEEGMEEWSGQDLFGDAVE